MGQIALEAVGLARRNSVRCADQSCALTDFDASLNNYGRLEANTAANFAAKNNHMKIKVLALLAFLTLGATAQPLYQGSVFGTVYDSATGAGVPNYPVTFWDSSSSVANTPYTLYTDANGFYMDSVAMYSPYGIFFIMVPDSCTGTTLTDYMVYSPNTPSSFVYTADFYVCSPGGGTGGGSPTATNCQASFQFDSVLTTMGNVVLYNTSVLDSSVPNAYVDYLWTFGDGSMATGPFPTHTYTQAGTFMLCLTLTTLDTAATGQVYSCTSTHCDTITIDSTGNVSYKNINVTLNVYSPEVMSIDEPTAAAPQLYPNPSNGAAYLKVEHTTTALIRNSTGAQVGQVQGSGTLRLPELPAGLYLITVKDQEGLHTLRWLVH